MRKAKQLIGAALLVAMFTFNAYAGHMITGIDDPPPPPDPATTTSQTSTSAPTTSDGTTTVSVTAIVISVLQTLLALP